MAALALQHSFREVHSLFEVDESRLEAVLDGLDCGAIGTRGTTPGDLVGKGASNRAAGHDDDRKEDP